ncbi:hypothetical protein [Actinokineospora bangkokensis]|uniref:ESX-1 secretion-associated protein n=1 Tax=Actinokineospora bangkokensis TaxID=1193682 RepID=A0A1Q9LF01_9PSEU|nr:hypothetical protein [Actinokineospora bangkokensis]OLR90594.1 hypothetical protein BJP25_28685 [Actinokineospora bangkokensis]
MDGYTTGGELAGIAGRVKAQAEPIGAQADAVDHGQVGDADFGRAFAGTGSAYTAALRDHLVHSIRAYATATSTYGDRLTDTHRQYAETEQANTGNVQGAMH